MRTLTLFELGIDENPIQGTNIIFFDKTSSFGMFERDYASEGKVEYLYGDVPEASSLEEALKKGGFINLTGEEPEDEEQFYLSIPLMCGDKELIEGTIWTYDHNFTAAVNPEMFPFQDYEYFLIAEENKWLDVLDTEKESQNQQPEGMPDKLEHLVSFNNKVFYLVWFIYGQSTQFHAYLVFDKAPSLDEARKEMANKF